ncbi:phage tail sheath subtilisin-like domain-containing protein [Chitinophaga sp. CF418]|uniref:phage tail sheath family protein n=1 Tax=Chitinophaga sp. CF418 TaxID=1855287 RepID=UPI0009219740|nr:phage tail sheath subtilisin-like domain-containing protein [Chitinophaga sp. CF418]SHN42243.1 hypothetical protein SAMN05216311_114149 [Chitinophaga sp. CF418]
MAFIHGTETIEISDGIRTVTEVRTSVIGLVGIAPKGPKNKLTLVRSSDDAALFGGRLPGFNIPHALNHIILQGAGTILVVNVFDEALHTEAVEDESHTVIGGELRLSAAPIGNVVITKDDGSAATYVAGTDYLLSEFGLFTVIKGRIPENTVLKFSFDKLKVSGVTDAHIIGAVDGSGNRTGAKCFDLAFTLYGYEPKILISPAYTSSPTVAAALLAQSDKLGANVVLDCAPDDTVPDALASRGVAATGSFNTSSQRAILAFPYVLSYDEATNSDQPFPYSAFYAGVMAATDNNPSKGYWFSPSNKSIVGVTGLATPVTASLNDPGADTNLLNAIGITTVFNDFGTGFRVWGNRNASYPTNTAPLNFVQMRRTADVVHRSLERAAMQFSDDPINQALADEIRQSGNNFINTLVGRGALQDGSRVEFNRADNPPADLANGQIKFRIVFMGATPAERITFLSVIDISLYSALK